MPDQHKPRREPTQLTVYQIRLTGQLSGQWTEWFEGLMVTLDENGDTLLTGPVVDQAALYGLLRKVRDLGASLISVNPVDPDQKGVPEVKS